MTSTTLNLVDTLLERARTLHGLGRTHDALRLLTQLAGFRELPDDVAEEVQTRLGQLWLRRKKFRRARRHFTAALRHRPDDPRGHYFLACALDQDPEGDVDRAADHFGTSLALDPRQPDCLVAYASLALRLGRVDEAAQCWRAAANQAPDDLKILAKAVKGLRQLGRADEARGLLVAARFRHPRDARYRALADHFRLAALRQEQQQSRQRSVPASAAVLLPFVRPDRPTRPTGGGRILRHDGPSTPTPHLDRSRTAAE